MLAPLVLGAYQGEVVGKDVKQVHSKSASQAEARQSLLPQS